MRERVEVECQNERCPGRTEAHSRDCICEGTGEVIVAGTVTVIEEAHDDLGVVIVGTAPTKPCTEEPIDIEVERWDATWHGPRAEEPGEWEPDIHCPRCGEEGVATE